MHNIDLDVFIKDFLALVNTLYIDSRKWNPQDDTLSGEVASVDIATKKNLNDLVKTGDAPLKKPVSRVDLETGLCEASKPETNEEALRRWWTIRTMKLNSLVYLKF